MIVSIEKAFNIIIPDEVYEKVKTVGALKNHLGWLIEPSVKAMVESVKAMEPLKEDVLINEHEPEPEEQEAA